MSLRRHPSNIEVVDEKKGDGVVGVTGREDGTDVEDGHMQELEVDMGHVLEDKGIEDIEGDTSPYPEGMFAIKIAQHLTTVYFNQPRSFYVGYLIL